jgi:hypothetical protein
MLALLGGAPSLPPASATAVPGTSQTAVATAPARSTEVAAVPDSPAGGPAREQRAAKAGGPAPDPLDTRREEIARQVLRIGAELQRQLAAGSTAGILARVPDTGMLCGDRLVPRARIARDLQGPGSWLHDTLLGGPASGGAESLRAFLAASRDVRIAVAFRRDARAGPIGRPCFSFVVPERRMPGVPFCFEVRGARWWLTQSLYPCD